MSFISNITTAFVFGVLTPLTAICVLPLFPGFLSYLSNQLGEKDDKHQILKLGILVSTGVISFMMILGLVFTTILQSSLTNVIGIVSPIAFGILGLISLMLMFNIELSRFFPNFQTPTSKNPKFSAFLFGFFFGAIIIPCNPLFIAALFSRALTITSFTSNFFSFIAFGVGISMPLLVLSALSLANSKKVTRFFIKFKKPINIISGVIMFVISMYYLFFVFRIIG